MAKQKTIISGERIISTKIIFEKDVSFLNIKKSDEFFIEYFDSFYPKSIVGLPYFDSPIGKKVIVFTPMDNSEKLYTLMHNNKKDYLFLLGGLYKKNMTI